MIIKISSPKSQDKSSVTLLNLHESCDTKGRCKLLLFIFENK
jgi:hypothetical protein